MDDEKRPAEPAEPKEQDEQREAADDGAEVEGHLVRKSTESRYGAEGRARRD